MGASHSKDDDLSDHRRSTSKKFPSLLKKCSTTDAIDNIGPSKSMSRVSASSSRITYPYPRGHSTVLVPIGGSVVAPGTSSASSGIRAPTAIGKRQPFSRRATTLNIPSPVPSGSEPSTTDNSANVSRSETREFVEDPLKETDEEKQSLKPKAIVEALSGLQEKECGGERNSPELVPCDPSSTSNNNGIKNSPIKTVAFLSRNKKVAEKPVLSKSLPAPRSILKAQSMEFTGKPNVVTVDGQQKVVVVAPLSQTATVRPTVLRNIGGGSVEYKVKNSNSSPANLKGAAPLAESECFIVENSPAVEFPPSSFPSTSHLPSQKHISLPVSKLATKSTSSSTSTVKQSSSFSSKIGQFKFSQTKSNAPTASKIVADNNVDDKKPTSIHPNLSNLASPGKGKSATYAQARLKNVSNYGGNQKVIYSQNNAPKVNKSEKSISLINENIENVKEIASNDLPTATKCLLRDDDEDSETLNNESDLKSSNIGKVSSSHNVATDGLTNAADLKRIHFASSKCDDSVQSTVSTGSNVETKSSFETSVDKKFPIDSALPSTFGLTKHFSPTTSTAANSKTKNVLHVANSGGIDFVNRTTTSLTVVGGVPSPKHEMHDSGVKTSDTSGGSDASNSKVTSPDGSIHRGLIDDEIKDQPDLTVGSQLDHQSASDQTLSGNEMDKGSSGPVRYRERIRKRSGVDRMTESYDSTISSASVDDDDLMLDFEGSVDFGESVDLTDSVYAANISGRKPFKGSWRKRSSVKRASMEVVMDEWNNLLNEVNKSSSQSQRLRSVSDVLTNSPPNCAKPTRPLRPPASLSIDCAGLPSVSVDQHTYRHLIQDVTVLKTLLFRLKRVLQEADTVNPFESSLAMKNGLLKTGLEELLNDQTSTEFTKDDLREENATLRTQVALMRQQMEEKDKTIAEQKRRLAEFERLHKIVPHTKTPHDVSVNNKKVSGVVVGCDKNMNGKIVSQTPSDSPLLLRSGSPTKNLSTDV